MILKLGMLHCLCEYYQGCSNYDPGLTLTYFTSHRVTFCYTGFRMGESENYFFLETIATLGLKVA